MAPLRQRIEQLENQQKGADIDTQIERLSSYGVRNLVDFDKYSALSMAESLASDAKQLNHAKASFLAVASQTLRGCLDKPAKQFQAYSLSLFPEKDYTQPLTASLRWTSPFVWISALPIFHIPRALLAESLVDPAI